MAYVIKFLSLQKSELEYEVELRGGVGESVQELRKQIVKLSQALPSEDILESHLDPSDDLKGVKESLFKSQGNLTILKAKSDKYLLSRTETILHHVYHRLNRINKSPEVAEVYKICYSNFNSQYKELCGLQPQTSNIGNKSSTSNTDTAAELSTVTVTCERNLQADIGKLKFSGKTCVRSFIQKVEEFVQSRGISYGKILSLAYEIFNDDALHWYRCNASRINTWDELRQLLKEDFSSSDYDYKLAAEIRSRTQGDKENITIYLSIMQGMFSRLDKPLSENDKLDILLHNIRPCYASVLSASPDIKTIDTLKTVCRNFENIQARFSEFREPPKASSSTIAPEFAYRSENFANTKPGMYNNTNYNKQAEKPVNNTNTNVAALVPTAHKPLFCPRCRTNDHTLRNCKEKKFLICFKCGRKDVRFSECPVCNPTRPDSSKN